MYGGVEVKLHALITSEVSNELYASAAEWSSERAPDTLFYRRMGGRQNRSGRGGEEKTPCPCRESNPDRSSP